MEALIKQHFPIEHAVQSGQPEVSLNNEEKNALRYTAGYVTRALRRKLLRSAHPHKEELIHCLTEMNADDDDTEDDSSLDKCN